MAVPVVDFSACGLQRADVDVEDMRSAARELHAAFTQVGLVFLQNSGISPEEVSRVLDSSQRFFQLPVEEKQVFTRSSFPNPNHGWVSKESESLNPERPADLKEAFNVSSLDPDIRWPSGPLCDFQEIQTPFFLRCKELSLRVLKVMALSLDLDPEVFLSAHRLIGTEQNGSTLRSLFYGPVRREKVRDNQLRCGEHSDYGSITLLFQGSEGLQVLSRSGNYLDVPLVPGAVLVNIADLMQRWTSDCFVSALHRVLLPPAGDCSTRQSLAFFVQPDNDAVIRCCDGSDKYPPVSSGLYLQQRLQAADQSIRQQADLQ